MNYDEKITLAVGDISSELFLTYSEEFKKTIIKMNA